MNIPWWLNPWREVRRRAESNSNLQRLLNAYSERIEHQAALAIKYRRTIEQQHTELAQLKRGLAAPKFDDLKQALQAGDAAQANRMNFRQAVDLNRKLRFILGDVVSAGYDLLQKSANQLDQTKGKVMQAQLEFACQETNVTPKPVNWPETTEPQSDQEIRRLQEAAAQEIGH